jgi:diketogulonate reductase-like aldo/keto reductase
MEHHPAQTRLHNGLQMPLLGLGMWDMYGEEAVQAVFQALETGYRLLDTAAMYHNETAAGEGLRRSGIPREEVFITSKVDNGDQGYERTLRGFDASLKALCTDYLDLYLIHWPLRNTRAETWKALEHIYAEGRVRAIGVANYLVPFLEELLPQAAVVPMLNQVEFSPWLYLEDLLDYCRSRHIVLQAYTPLVRGKRFQDPRLQALSAAYGKTPAQVILRWLLQHGVSAIPKSANKERIRENYSVFDFALSPADMAKMDGFHEGLRVVDDPTPML